MAAETPTKEPETVRAGDTIKWKKSVSDYAGLEVRPGTFQVYFSLVSALPRSFNGIVTAAAF